MCISTQRPYFRTRTSIYKHESEKCICVLEQMQQSFRDLLEKFQV